MSAQTKGDHVVPPVPPVVLIAGEIPALRQSALSRPNTPPAPVYVPLRIPYRGSSPGKYAIKFGNTDRKEIFIGQATSSGQDQGDGAHVNNASLPPTSLPEEATNRSQLLTIRLNAIMNSHTHANGEDVPFPNMALTVERRLPPLYSMIPEALAPLTPITPNSSTFEVQHLRNNLQMVQGASSINEQELARQRAAVAQLSDSNSNIYDYLAVLDKRIKELEGANKDLREQMQNRQDYSQVRVRSRARSITRMQIASYRGRGDGRSRSPSPSLSISREQSEQSAMTLTISELIDAGHSVSTLEEVTGSAVHAALDHTGGEHDEDSSITTAHTQDVADVEVKEQKSLAPKRKIHNVDKIMVSAFTKLPKLPLTDKEIVVYFFNSLSRPLVATRIYARGFGPAKITDIINAHRDIDPPFLRNTCSVKCTTAQKRGREWYGSEWDDLYNRFTVVDDKTATDMMLKDNQCTEDVNVLDLLNGLKKHADADDEGDLPTGIFTECIKYVDKHQVSMPLTKVHRIVAKLDRDRSSN